MLSRRLLLALLFAASTLLLPGAADARCKRTYLQPYIATPADTVLPIDGGAILIGLGTRTRGPDSMAALPTSFAIVKGDTRIELEVELLAPGFARAVPTEKPSAGTWTVEGVLSETYNQHNAFDEATVTFGDGTLTEAPAAPQVEAGSMTTDKWGRGRMRIQVHATLTAAAPKEAIYVVTNWAETPDASIGGAFGVSVEDNTLLAFQTRGRCTSSPTGERAPADGEKGVIRWVDQFGQVSAASEPFEVTETSP